MRTLNYDAAGRITSTVHLGGPLAPALNQTYYYDDLDRLTGFDDAVTSQRFSYDKNGNRTSVTFGGASYVNTISANSNRLTSTSGPMPAKTNIYDPVGNLLNDGTVMYAYGTDGRMASASSHGIVTTYSYNALGQRVAKIGESGPIAYLSSLAWS